MNALEYFLTGNYHKILVLSLSLFFFSLGITTADTIYSKYTTVSTITELQNVHAAEPIDNTLPSIFIVNPHNNEHITKLSTVNIDVNLADDIGIKQVIFFVDNIQQCIVSTPPYTCQWEVPNLERMHVIRAEATDLAGNIGMSQLSVITK